MLAGITLITPTGDRHLAFSRCEYYIQRQIVQPDQWIIVDDGYQPTKITLGQDYIRNKPFGEKVASILGNYKSLISEIKYNKIIIIEDDDWYHPKYVESVVQRLTRYDLVGEVPAHYYHIKFRVYRRQRNDHASLCQTAFISEVLPAFKTCLTKKSAFIDRRLWQKNINKRCFSDTRYSIGIKGMPGRKGCGIGHRPPDTYASDSKLKILKDWVGEEDAEWYIKVPYK